MKLQNHPLPIRSLLLFLTLLCTMHESSYSSAPRLLHEFRISKHLLVYVPVVVVGSPRKSFPFVLHTGAPCHAIDIRLRRFAKEVGDGVQKAPPSVRQYTMRLLDRGAATDCAVSLSVGNLPLGGQLPLHVQDLSLIEKATGEACFGVVGTPFLRDKLIQFDFDEGSLRVFARGSIETTAWGSQRLIVGPLGRPWCTGVCIGQRTEPFLVDTGCSGSIELHKWLFDSLVRAGHITSIRKTCVTTEQRHETRRAGRLDELTLGQFRHRNLDVVEAKENRFGLEYLKRYSIIFDLSGRRILLRKSKRYNSLDLVNETGINVLKLSGSVVIDRVAPNSIAEKSGVHENDEIVSINGRAVAQMQLHDIRRLLNEAHGKRVTLSLKRRGQVVSVSFVVQPDSAR